MIKPLGLLIVGLLAGAAGAEAQRAPRILVMPFENITRDGRIFWLGEASAVLLADDLNALGADAIAREERREALLRLQVPRTTALTDATVIRIGQLVGAAQVVMGSLQLEGDALVVRARNIGLDAGRVHHDITERGSIADLFTIFERVAKRLTPAAKGVITLPRPPVAAFENYIKGLLAETPATAVTYLNAALQLEPQFARARLALWDVYTEQGDADRALAAVRRIASDSPFSRQARFRTGLSQLHLKRYDDAFATYKALADERQDAGVLNNLGVVQLRRGGTGDAGPATDYFRQAARSDEGDADYFFNLGYAYWLNRQTDAAIAGLREAVRRDPADGDAHFVLGAALSAAGSGVEANREKELARRLSSTYLEWEKKAAGADPVPAGLERIKGDVALPRAGRMEAAVTSGRDQRELARFYLERGRRLFQRESDRDALAELNRTLFLSPYEAEAHLLVGRIHLRGGRVTEAIDALKISLWSADSAEARAALAHAFLAAKDLAAARAEAERALVLDPNSVEARRALERAKP